MTEAKAVARYIRVSPRKARRVVDLIRGKHIEEARRVLGLSRYAASAPIRKLLDSAAANAGRSPGVIPENLFVARAHVDEGPTLRRFRPRALGRATRIDKRTSHITIVLEQMEGALGGAEG